MLPMSIPRLVLTPELMGKTLGRPHDVFTQMRYLRAGLDLLENAFEGNTVSTWRYLGNAVAEWFYRAIKSNHESGFFDETLYNANSKWFIPY
jgi:hypothetical protein